MTEKTFTWRRRVEFRDTDMAGIVHFSMFFAYMEEAEHALFRALGLKLFEPVATHTGPEFAKGPQPHLSFPRVKATCDYRRAIRFEQEIDIDVTIERIGESSISWQYTFRCDGEVIATGAITTVCCLFDGDASPKSTSIPPTFREALKPYART